jgi:hypothetical protein
LGSFLFAHRDAKHPAAWCRAVDDAPGFSATLSAGRANVAALRRHQRECNFGHGHARHPMRTIKEGMVALSDDWDYTDDHQQLARFLDDVYRHKCIYSLLGHLTTAESEQHWQQAHLQSEPVNRVAEQVSTRRGSLRSRKRCANGYLSTRFAEEMPNEQRLCH